MIVYDRAIEDRIGELNDDLDPFYIVSLDNGTYSLCAIINEMEEEYGQAAFDAYAEEIGTDPRDEQGYIEYGSGYDIAAAFKEAFKDEPNLKRISFDCEWSGFFCTCDDVEILGDFGKRYRELCQDTEKFIPIVSAGIKNEKLRRTEEERLENSVRGQIMKQPSAEFYVRTPDADYKIRKGVGKMLLDGTVDVVYSTLGERAMDADEFLDQRISASQQDLFDEDSFKIMVESEQEEVLAPSMKM